MSTIAATGIKTRQLSITLTVIGFCGVALPFMPFAVDYVPISDVEWHWSSYPHFTLVLPCIVLPPVIGLGYIVWHAAGQLPIWATAGGFVLAAVSACAFLAGLLNSLEVSDPFELFVTGLFLTAFAGAAWLSVEGVNSDSPVRGLIAMQCVYSILMVFAIAAAIFWGDFQIGAWLGAAVLFAYFGQIASAVKQYRSMLVLVIPLAVIGWIFSVT